MSSPNAPKPSSTAPDGGPWPHRAYFEAEALQHPTGAALREQLRAQGCPITTLPAGQRTPRLGRITDPAQAYTDAKNILIANVHRSATFQTCRPSADYQLPLVTSCPGRCAYCYLQTTLGARPYVRTWVNIEQILARAATYAQARPASFEASATGDPLPLETLTRSLSAAIKWAAAHPGALLRVTTKFASIDPLLSLEHAGRTRIRLSVNPAQLVANWEPGTAPLPERIAAAMRLAAAGYPVGFMVAPVFAVEDWHMQYECLLAELGAAVKPLAGGGGPPRGADGYGLTLEIVTHRFTPRARDLIAARHAQAGLPLDESSRTWRMGQFGYGKYVYDRQTMAGLRAGLTEMASRYLPQAAILYVV